MTTPTVREESQWYHFLVYAFKLAKDLLCAPFHRQDNTYHGLSYTSCGALTGIGNNSMGPQYDYVYIYISLLLYTWYLNGSVFYKNVKNIFFNLIDFL